MEVGRMKVELKSELSDEIAKLPTRNDFYCAIAAGLIAAFGIFSIMGDRIKNAVNGSASLTATLERLAIQGEANSKALEALKPNENKSDSGPQGGKPRSVHPGA